MTDHHREPTIPASCCPDCGLSWHDCYRLRHEETRNCCPACAHLPDVDRERDEMKLDALRAAAATRSGDRARGLVAIIDIALTLDYRFTEAMAWTPDDLRFSSIEMQFYVDSMAARGDACRRLRELTGPYFDRMPADTVMRDVLALMPAEERAEVQRLFAIVNPTGVITLPLERNTRQ